VLRQPGDPYRKRHARAATAAFGLIKRKFAVSQGLHTALPLPIAEHLSHDGTGGHRNDAELLAFPALPVRLAPKARQKPRLETRS
jgi:hypothetical protein